MSSVHSIKTNTGHWPVQTSSGWQLKGCVCGGDMYEQIDQYGNRWVCFQCGRDIFDKPAELPDTVERVRVCETCGKLRRIFNGKESCRACQLLQ